jgi:hypothetical protein
MKLLMENWRKFLTEQEEYSPQQKVIDMLRAEEDPDQINAAREIIKSIPDLFINANLEGVNMEDASLNDINLSGANLKNANLSGASLEDSNLSGANLSNANLQGALIWYTNLSGADLSGADLERAWFEEAVYDKQTRFPSGFNPETERLTRNDEK